MRAWIGIAVHVTIIPPNAQLYLVLGGHWYQALCPYTCSELLLLAKVPYLAHTEDCLTMYAS